MSVLRVSVVLVTIIALLVFVYYTVLELVAVWRAMTTLSYQPITAVTEQSAYMLLFDTIAYSLLVVLLLVGLVAILHFSQRVL